MSHTPGPWRIVDSMRTAVNSKFKHIAMVNYSHRGAPSDVHGEEHAANAHLIAAAPDMYEALKACIDDPDYCSKRPLVAAKARAALAKAEGRNE